MTLSASALNWRRHAVVLSICAVGLAGGAMAQTNGTGNASLPRGQARFEQRLLTTLIDHHLEAVAVAETCLARTNGTDEITQVCEQVRTSELARAQQLQTLLQQWYNTDYRPVTDGNGGDTNNPTGISTGDQGKDRRDDARAQRFARLDDQRYGREILDYLIDHHAEGIRRSIPAFQQAYHVELIDVLQEATATDVEEIKLFRTYLCQLYNRCSLEVLP